MEIKITIDDEELKNKIIEFYANKLYEDKIEKNWLSLLGADKDIKEIVQKEAIKYLVANQSIKKKIETLVTNNEFLKEAVKEALVDESESILRELKS